MSTAKKPSRKSATGNAPPSSNQKPPSEKVVIADRFVLTDPNHKQRALLFIEADMVMLALRDQQEETRLLLAVTPEGATLISVPHRLADGQLGDSFRLVVSNGEPEIVLQDAIFKDTIVLTARGLCPSE
jgi:hypothetical protein